ncbi:MAG: ABC transporter permease [Saprospiraceae bacterium]
MFDRDTWQEIFASIKKHKLRTGLTALGVFWGIFMLVFVVGMGKGLENGVFRDFGNQAKNIMYVQSRRTTLPYQGFQPGRRPVLKLDDIAAIKSGVGQVENVAPRLSIYNANVTYQQETETREIRGEFGNMLKVEAIKLYSGRYINDNDLAEYRKVAVLGDRTRELLFGEEEAIGQSIQIKGVEFTVVGSFGPEQIKPWTESDLEAVVIPLTTMHRTFGTGEVVDYFICSAAPNVRVSEIEPTVISLMKERHHVSPKDPRGITGFNLEEEFQSIVNLFKGISFFLWFVGIGTLLAGIVGVSNIMLIIVKERTREIGLRKALGATPNSIITMILTESVFITALSGYLGLIVGTGLIGGIDYLMLVNDIQTENFYHPEIQSSVGLGAVIILILAGTFAGLIPALQAAKVNPVNALKDE